LQLIREFLDRNYDVTGFDGNSKDIDGGAARVGSNRNQVFRVTHDLIWFLCVYLYFVQKE